MNPRIENCITVGEALPLYVGADLTPPARRLAVEQHLRECGACRSAAARALAARSALLEGLRPTGERKVDLWTGVRAGLVRDGVLPARDVSPRQPAPRSARRPWMYVPLAGLAAAAAVAALWLRVAPTVGESPLGGREIVSPAPSFVSTAPHVVVTPVSDRLHRLAPTDEVWGDQAVNVEDQQTPRGLGLWNSNPNLGSPAGYFTPGKTR